jgi:hypothetical protein
VCGWEHGVGPCRADNGGIRLEAFGEDYVAWDDDELNDDEALSDDGVGSESSDYEPSHVRISSDSGDCH